RDGGKAIGAVEEARAREGSGERSRDERVAARRVGENGRVGRAACRGGGDLRKPVGGLGKPGTDEGSDGRRGGERDRPRVVGTAGAERLAVSVVPLAALAVTEVKAVACSKKPAPEKVAEVGVAVKVLLPDASERNALSVVPLAAVAKTFLNPLAVFENLVPTK